MSKKPEIHLVKRIVLDDVSVTQLESDKGFEIELDGHRTRVTPDQWKSVKKAVRTLKKGVKKNVVKEEPKG